MNSNIALRSWKLKDVEPANPLLGEEWLTESKHQELREIQNNYDLINQHYMYQMSKFDDIRPKLQENLYTEKFLARQEFLLYKEKLNFALNLVKEISLYRLAVNIVDFISTVDISSIEYSQYLIKDYCNKLINSQDGYSIDGLIQLLKENKPIFDALYNYDNYIVSRYSNIIDALERL